MIHDILSKLPFKVYDLLNVIVVVFCILYPILALGYYFLRNNSKFLNMISALRVFYQKVNSNSISFKNSDCLNSFYPFCILFITPVILYNFFPNVFKYGYLGIDCLFFVFGYYLIKYIVGILMPNNRLGLASIILHVAKLIYPLITFVILLTTILTFNLISVDRWNTYAKDIYASIFQFANLWFAGKTSEIVNINTTKSPLFGFWGMSTIILAFLIILILVLLCAFVTKCIKSTPFTKAKIFDNLLIIVFTPLTGISLVMLFIDNKFSLNSYYGFLWHIWEFLLGSLVMLISRRTKALNKAQLFKERLIKILQNKVLVLVGKISLVMYFWNYLVIAILHEKYSSDSTALLIGVVLLLGISLFSYFMVIKPVLVSNQLKSPLKIVAFLVLLVLISLISATLLKYQYDNIKFNYYNYEMNKITKL